MSVATLDATAHAQSLQRLMAVLSRALTPKDVASAVIDDGRQALGAQAALIYLRGADGTLHLADSYGISDETRRLRGVLSLDAPVPLADAIRNDEPVWIPDRTQLLAGYPHLANVPSLDDTVHAVAALPMRAGGELVGGLAFSFATPRAMDAGERAFLLTLAAQCAIAAERSRLFQREREARDVAERANADADVLLTLADSIQRADDEESVYRPALSAVERALQVDRSAILLHDAAGVMRFRAWTGLSDTYRAAVEGHSPWARNDPAPAPVVVPDTNADEALAAYRPLFDAEAIRALAFIPLVHGRELLGKFMVYVDRPRAFSEHELRLVTTIAGQVAQAVVKRRAESENVRLLRLAEQARKAAEEGARARDRLLAVVSHDLRSPLSTVTLASALLASSTGDDSVRRQADRIQRASASMRRLISDLMDLAAIESNMLQIAREPLDAASLVDDAVQALGPLASEREQALIAVAAPSLPRVSADRERILQVFTNVVGNAIKFTPVRGTIEVAARAIDTGVEFRVKDSGPGLPAEHVARVFEPYWRAGSDGGKGVGLGLAIAKGIVEAHGGAIWAESMDAGGCTFFFTIPAHAD